MIQSTLTCCGSWLVLLFSLAFLAVNPEAQGVASTTLAPDTHAPNFIGYVHSPTGYVRVTCPPELLYSSSGSWAACLNVSHTRTAIATTCVSESMAVYPRSSVKCPESAPLCGFDYVNSDLKDEAPLTMVGCGNTTDPWDYYRETTSPASSSSTKTAESDFTTLDTFTVSRTNGIATTSNIPIEDAPSQQASLVWIAGPIVGGIIGIGILAMLVWIVILLRRRNNTK